jgi:hypothetical protein
VDELAAGGDAELPEHLAQVVVDGVGAEYGWAPISALVALVAASRVTSASWGVRL